MHNLYEISQPRISEHMPEIITDPLRQKLLLCAVLLGVIVDGLDGSIVNVILPTMAIDFGVDPGTISWVVVMYLLMLAGFILVFGKLADTGLLRKIFILGFIFFTIGSAVCGLSPNFVPLLIARAIQGFGAAMLAAAAPLFCIRYLPSSMLGVSLAVLTVGSSIGFAAGPAIGGLIASVLSWHWVFLINVPIGIFAVIFTLLVIPKDGVWKKCVFDFPGAVALFILMASGIYVLELFPLLGITNMGIITATILCIISIILFIIRELKCRDPLINVRIFGHRRFTLVLLSFLILNVVFAGIIYLLPFYLSSAMHFDTATISLYLLIQPVITGILSIPFGRWSDRTGRRWFCIVSCTLLVVSSILFALLVPEMGILPLISGLVSLGIMWGMAGGPVASRIVEEAPEKEKATGSSLMITVLYFGTVVGIALFVAVFTWVTGGDGVVAFADLPLPLFIDGFHAALWVGAVVGLIGLILSYVVTETKKGLD